MNDFAPSFLMRTLEMTASEAGIGLGLLYFAPTFAAAPMLASDDIRAMAAVLLFCLTLVGSSVGPFVIGWASDALAVHAGVLSLRYALCFLAITMAWSSLYFILAARSLSADIRTHEESSNVFDAH